MTTRLAAALLVLAVAAAPVTAFGSTQCGPSDADPSVTVHPAAVPELDPSLTEDHPVQPVAAFRITGVRPQRALRVGLHSWADGVESAETSRAGFESSCEPFEHWLIVWMEELAKESLLSVSFTYAFPQNPQHQPPQAIEYSSSAAIESRAIREPVTLAVGEDLVVWGVYSGAVPNEEESLASVAERAGTAMLLHVKNSPH